MPWQRLPPLTRVNIVYNLVARVHRSRPLNHSLTALKARLEYVNRAWAAGSHERLLRFYVRTIPKLLDAERCSLFVLDPRSGKIVSKHGTGLAEGDIEAPAQGSVVGQAISTRASVTDNELGRTRGFHRDADAKTGFVTRSILCVPITGVAGCRVTGAIEVLNKRTEAGFDRDDESLLVEIAEYVAVALDNILINAEVARISREINREVSRCQSDYLGEMPFVAESDAMRKVLELVRMVCDTPVNVLIQGENGTGKEVVARMIHEGRDRRSRPFVPVNCAAIPEHLMESEFFGYEKGAFTGAAASRGGRFEEAHRGTLFLDEVADIPLAMQPKFLRALQEGEGMRLGGSRLMTYDLSVISATNRNLRDLLAQGQFRQDLFYRLFAVEIVVPPLRDRPEDIAPLTAVFLEDVCRQYGKVPGAVSRTLMAQFEDYAWPGNVRQLRREVERLVALTPEGEALVPERCSPELSARGSGRENRGADELRLPERVRTLELSLIRRALERTGGHKARAAELLGITRQGLHKKLRRYAP